MLDSWNLSIFSDIKNRLQDSAMKLVHAERNGEAFDSQLVIGVRESYGEPKNFHQLIGSAIFFSASKLTRVRTAISLTSEERKKRKRVWEEEEY